MNVKNLNGVINDKIVEINKIKKIIEENENKYNKIINNLKEKNKKAENNQKEKNVNEIKSNFENKKHD